MVVGAQTDKQYRMEIGAGIGTMTYLGDYNAGIFQHQQPAITAVVKRLFNPFSVINLSLSVGRIKGKETQVKTVYPQQYVPRDAFNHRIADLTIAYEYNFWPYGTGNDYYGAKPITPFLTMGIGGTYVGGVKTFTANIPLGVGIKYKMAKRVNLSLQWIVHFTMSDNLDGIKDPYGINSSGLFKNKDAYSALQLAVTYSFSQKCATCNKE